MEAEFEYLIKKEGACVTKILAPGAVCVIPETLDGVAVTELADRLFAGSGVEEVFLPKSLKRIGRYGFYNCEKLHTLHFYSTTMEIGGGIFNGCRNVRELYVHMEGEGRSALRDFVTEINERLTVHCLFPDGNGEERETARLIFPIYYDEAVENTPARITVSNIHGSGQRYRYCFVDKKVQFEKYDQVFVYEKAEEPLLLAAELAMFRLMFPQGLWEKAKRQYEEFLRENLFEVLWGNLRRLEQFKWLFEQFADDKKGLVESGNRGVAVGGETAAGDSVHFSGVEVTGKAALTPEELERLITEASRLRLPEITGILMDYRHRVERPKEKKKRRFEF